MKKWLLLLSCTCTLYADAQQLPRFYLQAGGDVWAGRQMRYPSTPYDLYFGPGYGAGLSGGIAGKRWRVELGVHVLTQTTTRVMMIYFDNLIDPQTGQIINDPIEARLSERYRYVLVPLTAGYRLLQYRKLSITPFAGIAGSYNYAYDQKAEGRGLSGEWRSTDFNTNGLVRKSIWGGGGVEVRYQIHDRMELGVDPAIWYMLSSFSHGEPVKQHTYIMGGSVSLRYLFRAGNKKATAPVSSTNN